jgi:chemotaxis protein CheC
VTPNDRQLDALREVANVGAGHAANALSRLVGGRKVAIEVSRASLVDTASVPALVGREGERVVAAFLGILGEVHGVLALVLPEDAAQSLCALLLNAPCDTIAEAARDALAETSNILGSACLTALSHLTGYRLIPSVPTLLEGTAEEVVRALAVAGGEPGQVALVLETQLLSPPVVGQLFLMPAPQSVRPLLERLGV